MFATITHPVTSRVPLKPLPIRETFSMSFRRTKLATAMVYAVGALGVTAQAQTPPPAPAQQVEGITVTGSRIPQPNLLPDRLERHPDAISRTGGSAHRRCVGGVRLGRGRRRGQFHHERPLP